MAQRVEQTVEDLQARIFKCLELQQELDTRLQAEDFDEPGSDLLVSVLIHRYSVQENTINAMQTAIRTLKTSSAIK